MYNIWYMRQGSGFLPMDSISLDALESTHVRVAEGHRAKSLEEAYTDYRADMWDKARYEIWGNYACNKCGASHATMMVGDVIEDLSDGTFHAVDIYGFKQLS